MSASYPCQHIFPVESLVELSQAVTSIKTFIYTFLTENHDDNLLMKIFQDMFLNFASENLFN